MKQKKQEYSSGRSRRAQFSLHIVKSFRCRVKQKIVLICVKGTFQAERTKCESRAHHEYILVPFPLQWLGSIGETDFLNIDLKMSKKWTYCPHPWFQGQFPINLCSMQASTEEGKPKMKQRPCQPPLCGPTEKQKQNVEDSCWENWVFPGHTHLPRPPFSFDPNFLNISGCRENLRARSTLVKALAVGLYP